MKQKNGPTQPTAPLDPEGDGWREWLFDSLRDCGASSPRRHPVRQTVLFVLAVIVIGCCCSVFSHFELLFPNAGMAASVFGIIVLLVIVWFVLMPVQHSLMRNALMHRSRTAEKELRRSARRPIFYLRSFGLDQRIARPVFWERFLNSPLANAEQRLVARMRKVGPVIAIGRPNEMLPALGAARFYVSHDRWQEKVSDVARVAQLVVWTTGVSEGLRWELSHLLKSLPPEKLILWAHPNILDLDAFQRDKEWSRFLDALGSLFPKPLPTSLGQTRFFAFGPDFEPIEFGTRRWTRSGAQSSALKRLLQAKSVRP